MNQSATTIDASATEALRKQTRGTITLPQDAGYDQARKVYNAMIDKHPAIIIRCVDVADVMASLPDGLHIF